MTLLHLWVLLILKNCLVCMDSYLLLEWMWLWMEMVKAVFFRICLNENNFFIHIPYMAAINILSSQSSSPIIFRDITGQMTGPDISSSMWPVWTENHKFVGAKLFDCLIPKSLHHLILAWQKILYMITATEMNKNGQILNMAGHDKNVNRKLLKTKTHVFWVDNW